MAQPQKVEYNGCTSLKRVQSGVKRERVTGMDDEKRMQSVQAEMPIPSRKPRFFGSYDHSIDAKGRIIIPTVYRKDLGESFTITVGLDDQSIALYPDAAFDEMVEALYQMNRRKPSVQRQQDHIAKYSYPGMQADNQGRVLLPVKLRQYILGDAKDVEISGALDHIRIVDSTIAQDEDAYYKEHNEEIRNEIAEMED